MKAHVYMNDEVLQQAASKYHRAKGEDYNVSELVQVGLVALAGLTVPELKRIIKARREAQTRESIELPGLRRQAQSRSGG